MANISNIKLDIVKDENFIKKLEEKNLLEIFNQIQIGQYLIRNVATNVSHDYGIRKILDLKYDEKYHNIRIICTSLVDINKNIWSDDKHIHDNDINFIDYISKFKILDEKEFKEYLLESSKILSGDININDYNQEDTLETGTALLGKSSQALLVVLQKEIELKKQKYELLQTFMQIQIEQQKRSLDNIRQKLNGQISLMNKQVQKIVKIVTTIELYLGIGEEIVQLAAGETSLEPIVFRQQPIYMDEEFKSWNKQGIGFDDLELFDNWLVTDKNYLKFFPDEKGMIALKPRRFAKEYNTGDWYLDAVKKAQDTDTTYFLIKNGDNIYRVYTDKISIGKKLFPNSDEITKFFSADENGELSVKDKREYENFDFTYKKQALFIQGLIDRTEIFKPLKSTISVFNLETLTDDVIRFVYDCDENVLAQSTKPLWKDFIKSKGDIKHGDRIILYGHSDSRKYSSDRFLKYYENDYSIPELPEYGLYEVEEYTPYDYRRMTEKEAEEYMLENGIEKFDCKNETNYVRRITREKLYDYGMKQHDKTELSILYFPGSGKRWNHEGDLVDRKKRIRFIIKQHDCILNFDSITKEECEYYLTSRADRKNYLEVMPALHFIVKHKDYEEKIENEFAKMISSHLKLEYEDCEEYIKEKIKWWKLKNTVKRPLTKDDEKAFRMIVQKIQKEFKDLGL